ncbi:hypothetical protein DFJ73DRAFT_85342 [Zopfochytrium polystomum]|nr:hypothetical protein DFJ73DRAFT_85342 [Zopfochytrium polystomum]
MLPSSSQQQLLQHQQQQQFQLQQLRSSKPSAASAESPRSSLSSDSPSPLPLPHDTRPVHMSASTVPSASTVFLPAIQHSSRTRRSSFRDLAEKASADRGHRSRSPSVRSSLDFPVASPLMSPAAFSTAPSLGSSSSAGRDLSPASSLRTPSVTMSPIMANGDWTLFDPGHFDGAGFPEQDVFTVPAEGVPPVPKIPDSYFPSPMRSSSNHSNHNRTVRTLPLPRHRGGVGEEGYAAPPVRKTVSTGASASAAPSLPPHPPYPSPSSIGVFVEGIRPAGLAGGTDMSRGRSTKGNHSGRTAVDRLEGSSLSSPALSSSSTSMPWWMKADT